MHEICEMSSEANLYFEVVGQAIRDLGSPQRPVAVQAWYFLTDATGTWATSRAYVCLAAGLDPDWLRKLILSTKMHPDRVRDLVSAQRSAGTYVRPPAIRRPSRLAR